LEARKKKNKKAKVEEDVDFPGREEIKFGDVVEAPPKLITVPKVSTLMFCMRFDLYSLLFLVSF